MNTLELLPVVATGFALKPELKDGTLVVQFSGNGDLTAVSVLGSYLRQVHQEVGRLGVAELRFDLRDLYFMNSSCLKAFVTLIDTVARDTTGSYIVRFFSNPQLHWQKRSLDALKRLAPRVVHVDG